MALIGMDVEAVRGLAQQLQQKGQEINEIANTLTQQLSSAQWIGTDATRFRDDWNSQHAKNLHQVAEALRNAGQAATANAQQQEDASRS